MKPNSIVYFICAVLLVFALINYYIYCRSIQAFGLSGINRTIFSFLFFFIAASFLTGRFLERTAAAPIAGTFNWVGSFWLAAMSWFFLIVVLIDILRLSNYFLPWFPSFISNNPAKTAQTLAKIILVATSVALTYGYFNALYIRVRTLSINIPHKTETRGSISLVMASDVHLGTIVGRGRFNAIVDKINALNPDIILFPGDLVDEDLGPVIRKDLGSSLRRLKATKGVFVSTGNHEYIGGAEKACRYYTDHGLVVLRDSWVKIEPGIFIVGREDYSLNRFSGKNRRSLPDILSGTDRSCPVILMDHQPNKLSDAQASDVDLQLSGHTHHGQIWPFNYITNWIFEKSYGYLKKGNTHYYVSSGAGTWGPPVRIAADPEIVQIRISWGE